MNEPGAVVLARHWGEPGSELAFVTRSLAGAASRWGPVSVLVPGRPDGSVADGAFDVVATSPDGGAPAWPADLSPDGTVIVDELTPDTADLLAAVRPRAVLYLTMAPGTWVDSGWSPLRVAETPEPAASPLAPLYVPVNDMASRQRHHGFGFVGYIVVLPTPTDHGGRSPEAAWLTAALHDADVVVVEDAVASVWKGRALRGQVSVDSRMDLWRLLAHASVCVDLAPGVLVARECVEALQFGTPILVPAGTGAASAYAARGGGATFEDPSELVDAADALRRPPAHDAAAASGRRYARSTHGDSRAFVARIGSLLGAR